MPLPYGWTCRIKEFRLRLPKNTQEWASLMLEMDRSQYAKIERGDVLPSVLTAIHIAKFFGVSVEDLYYQETKKK